MALPALLVSGSFVLAIAQVGCASQATQADTTPAAEVMSPSSPPSAQSSSPSAAQAAWSPDELNQLVAPIALYPDALVAQIVAAASYPTEVVEADRWLQQNSSLKGAELATAADSQSWDPSVKAVTQFPSVLAMLDKNLSWTSALGEAYVDQPQKVLDAVQVMRQRAQQAGNLKTTPQEDVTSEGQTIAIAPADPDVVYVPEYDPWDVYGDPLAFYPGWSEVRTCSSGLEFSSASESASEFSAALVGVGTIGELTGTITSWITTTTGTSPTARPSSITIEVLAAIEVLVTQDLPVTRRWAQAAHSPENIPARSAASIMAASRTHIRPGAG